MATQTSFIAQQVRIRQWAEQIRACQNRPAGWNLSSAFKTQKGCQRKYFPVHHQRSSVSLSRYSIMLNDADASGFKKVYLAMGFTDLRRGIDG